tara:strand:- start:245 stop:514 length:270 start_codon:yes stop_codon:yes gene_type:complete
MPKKRRKLSKELESKISSAAKAVELITAQINDIDEEEILLEYKKAFDPIKYSYTYLATLYKSDGITEQSSKALVEYENLLKNFKNEYEI